MPSMLTFYKAIVYGKIWSCNVVRQLLFGEQQETGDNDLEKQTAIQNMSNKMEQFSGVFFATAIAFFVWFAGYMGLLSVFDVVAYDLFVKAAPNTERSGAVVLLIDYPEDAEHVGQVSWSDIVKNLQNLGAERIVFSFVPGGQSDQFWQEVKNSNKIVVGREISEDPQETGKIVLKAMPYGTDRYASDFGIVAHPPWQHGVYRQQATKINLAGNDYAALEMKAAQLAGIKSLPEEENYLVNFCGGQELFRVSLERVLAKGLVPELVKGKTVLIGLRHSVREAGFYTPLGKQLTLLEYQGYALDTLLRGRVVRDFGPVWAFLLTIIVALIIVVGANLFDMRGTLLFSTVILATVCILSWLALSYFAMWAPFVRIMVTLIIVTALLIRRKFVVAERSADAILLDLSTKLRARFLPESFYDSDEYWSQMITMMDQILNLSRVILLEKVPQDHRVREVKALHCSINDIHEMRRDYERTPYSTAITQGGVIKLDRPFFKKSSSPEEQYLVPLAFGGQIIGFWAFGIDPAKSEMFSMFHEVVRDFASQMSELLYRRQEWRKRSAEEQKVLQSFISLRFQDLSQMEVRSSIDLLERRLVLLERLFSGLDAAVLLYDVFGRVLQANEKMIDLAQTHQFSIYEMTALDFAVVLSGLDQEKMRLQLYKVILNHIDVTVEVKGLVEDVEQRILRIKPIIGDMDSAEFPGISAMGVYGILFEIQKKQMGQTADRQCSPWPAIPSTSSFAVNPVDIIAQTSKSIEEALMRRRITVQQQIAGENILVNIENNVLREIFKAIMAVLANDAMEGSVIAISVTKREGLVLLTFAARGFGMPDDTLQRYLFAESASVSGNFLRLRRALDGLKFGQGEFAAESAIDKGITFTLRLKAEV